MPATLPPEVAAALDRGQLVEAIKLLRASGMEATAIKEAVDAYMRTSTSPRFQKKDEAPGAPALSVPTITSPADPAKGLSPGEVSRSGGAWRMVLAVVAALVAWWAWRHLR